MAAITTRQTGTTGVDGVTRKNSPLTNTEIDTNFINLNNNKLESSWTGNTSIVTLGTVATGTWNATTISVAKGGTGLTSTPANGALDIGNGSGFTRTTLTGTTNRISVTNGAGSITLSTPQDIATSSNVQFGSLGVGTAASGTAGELRAPLGQITTLIVGTLTFGDSTVQSTAAITVPSVQVFTISGTFTVPANVNRLKVTVVGGGGNGGANLNIGCGAVACGGGGGGGGSSQKWFTVTPGTTFTVTVGAAGGTSSFGSACSATGGSAGAAGSSTGAGGGGGQGGIGSNGTLNIGGSSGVAGASSGVPAQPGRGGSSILGGGSTTAGRAYGGGGGGGSQAGAAGVVIVEY